MTNTKHTPGPWGLHIGGDYTRILREPDSHTDDYIAEVYSDGLGAEPEDDDVNREANARLIAAAPDTKAVADNFEFVEKDDGLWLVLHGNGTTGKAMFNLGRKEGLAYQVAMLFEEQRRAAIAKATGQAA